MHSCYVFHTQHALFFTINCREPLKLLVVISSFISYKLYPQHNGSNIDIDVAIATILQTIL